MLCPKSKMGRVDPSKRNAGEIAYFACSLVIFLINDVLAWEATGKLTLRAEAKTRYTRECV